MITSGYASCSVLPSDSVLVSEDDLDMEKIQELASRYNTPFILASAKFGDNTNEAFHEIAQRVA